MLLNFVDSNIYVEPVIDLVPLKDHRVKQLSILILQMQVKLQESHRLQAPELNTLAEFKGCTLSYGLHFFQLNP